jgi:NAD+ synthase (glutamine-hydrolysing)
MKLIKVGAAVLNQIPFDWENNKRNILDAIHAARRENISLLCMPELCITGYGCEDDFFRTDLRDRAWEVLQEILPETRSMVVSVGLPVLYNNALFNCAALLVDGALAGLVAKQNLAGDGIHYEPRWFEQWQEKIVSCLEIHDEQIPIGDIHFSVGGVKVGFEICEDAWIARRPGARLATKGVDIFLNPSASHFSFGKMDIRKRLVLEGSRAFCASYIYTNLLGNEAGRAIYDGGAIIASAGKLLSLGGRFSFHNFEITSAVVDVEMTRMAQSRTFSYRPDLTPDESDCVYINDFVFPDLRPPAPQPIVQAHWEKSVHLKEEELARSLALGLFDYMRKTRSRGYTLSLSGGADSSTVACLISLFIEFGLQELGEKGFKEKLSYLPELAPLKNAREIMGALLNCAYQASANSSHETLESARALAADLGARFYEFNVSKIVDDYTDMVAKAVGRKLTWQTDDLALQNIQARVRSPGIWLLANLHGSVLLCTSNRSEGAVGYCTMDGDTSGGLAPIAGVDKAFIREWLRWMEKDGPSGLHPYKALGVVNQQTPGPELRPPEAAQAGESDLMPYEVLDAIEESAIEHNESARDVYELMRVRFPQYSPKQIAEWIEKFFRLWSRNQWKRERLAPALHVATRNLDPRTWRRSPIISGGFSFELQDMWALARTDIDAPPARNAAGFESGNGKTAHSKDRTALLIIDVQNGFGSNGELAVPHAEQVVPIINDLMPEFSLVVASQDWHPTNHVSFAHSHSGKAPGDTVQANGVTQPLFPAHCVAGTHGSEFIDGLNIKAIDRVFRKGTNPDVDSLSAFNDNTGKKATELEEFLKAQNIRHVYVTGLATNYCVLCSALDAVNAGFEVTVITDACRGIDNPPGAVQESLDKMRQAGIKLQLSSDIRSQQKV